MKNDVYALLSCFLYTTKKIHQNLLSPQNKTKSLEHKAKKEDAQK